MRFIGMFVMFVFAWYFLLRYDGQRKIAFTIETYVICNPDIIIIIVVVVVVVIIVIIIIII